MESETKEVKSIDQKLFELQNEIGKIKKDKNNPFHKSKYFDINSLLDALKPELQKQKLLLKQPINDNKVYSIIIDIESGDQESCYLDLQQNDNPQKVGSEITYYRRYTLQSLLALEAEDDDGNDASGNTTGSDKEKITQWLSDEQFKKALNCGNAKQIQNVLNQYKNPPKGMKKAFRLQLTDEVNRLNK